MPDSSVAPLHITIHRQSANYPIFIGSALLLQLGDHIRQVLPNVRKLLIVTNPTVWNHYGEVIQPGLSASSLTVDVIQIPEGESHKSQASLTAIWQAAQMLGLGRTDAIIAVGGGVIGDLAGFAAATYYRGISFVQVPTTLLAQVDSSVGGKVGINLGQVKNSIGAFYQPGLVVADIDTLKTLPDREIKAGMAEVVKYALIETTCTGQNPRLFAQLVRDSHNQPLGLHHLPSIIHQCCEIKAAVVTQDETEQSGLRALLNLGHTFGHAYEGITSYQTYLHGEAVAIGTLLACRMAEALGQFKQTAQVIQLYQQLGLPTQPWTQHEPQVLLPLMEQDKKNIGGNLTLILPTGPIGNVEVKRDININQLNAILSAPHIV